MVKKKRYIHYAEGDCLVLPLQDGGFARAVISRAYPKVESLWVYLFGPRLKRIEDAAITSDLQAKNAIDFLKCGDHGVVEQGTWKILGPVAPWIRAQWPIPVFGIVDHFDPLCGEFRLYDETMDKTCYNYSVSMMVTAAEVEGYPKDHSYGYIAAECHATQLLQQPKITPLKLISSETILRDLRENRGEAQSYTLIREEGGYRMYRKQGVKRSEEALALLFGNGNTQENPKSEPIEECCSARNEPQKSPSTHPVLSDVTLLTMRKLRRNLSQIIRHIRDYIADSKQEYCTSDNVDQLKKILEDFLSAISRRKKDRENLVAATKKTVVCLNEFDEKTDHEIIESEERDMLCQFMINGALYVGFDDWIEEIDHWREW